MIMMMIKINGTLIRKKKSNKFTSESNRRPLHCYNEFVHCVVGFRGLKELKVYKELQRAVC